jgi:hypothetical protein
MQGFAGPGFRVCPPGRGVFAAAMAETTNSPAKTPWHLWTVGAVSLLWNMMGALDFTMTQMRNEAYMKQFTPEQLAYFYGFPTWVVLAWGLATWGSLVGSVLLLMRNKLAVRANQAVIVGMALTFTHNFMLSDGLKVMGGPGAIAFTAVIIVVGVLLLVYSLAMCKRGVLR